MLTSLLIPLLEQQEDARVVGTKRERERKRKREREKRERKKERCIIK